MYETDVSVPEVDASQPVAGATPPLVLRRWTYVTLLKTPVPVVDDARRSSQGTAPDTGALTCSTLTPLTTLPSLEVHSGPMPCVPT